MKCRGVAGDHAVGDASASPLLTPIEYLSHLRRLARKRDMVGIMAFTDEHLTEEMLDAMTPHERRRVHSVIHVAETAVGEGVLSPPTGIPIDEDDDDLVAAS